LAGDIDGFAAAAGDYLRKAGLLALEQCGRVDVFFGHGRSPVVTIWL